MMTFKRTFRTVLAFMLACSVLTIGVRFNTVLSVKSDNGYIVTDKYEVWSAPSTVKIIKEEGTSLKNIPELNYLCVKNEYESFQLGITAKKAIRSYYLTANNLNDGQGNTISAENFNIYNELYYYFDGNSVDASPNYYRNSMLKSYPDALVPIDLSYNAGECTINEKENAAIWVTVYIPKETVSGEYNGTFKLVIDGEEHNIPVSVKVFDYTLTDENNAGSTFTMRNYKIGEGEMDTSIKMLEAYYEFSLDYRISPRTFPQENVSSIDEFIEKAIKYYGEYSNFALGKSGNITLGIDYEYEKEQLLALAENSTEDRDLISKAIFYAMDEPNLNYEKTKYDCVYLVRRIKALLEEVSYIIDNDTTGRYDSFKKIDGWKEEILDMPNVVPFGTYSYVSNALNCDDEMSEEYVKNITWCPCWDLYDDSTRYAYLQLAEKAGNPHLWWYSCTGPTAPYATYHMADDNLLSSRTISWLQKKYNVEGNLYWDIVGYSQDTPLKFTDIYTRPNVEAGLTAGDGNLCYPGAKYGHYGPLPSIRIMSIRDGLEEYEMLLDLENWNKALLKESGINIDESETMEVYYSQLAYSGAKMYADGENGFDFGRLRESLLIAVSDKKTGFSFTGINTVGSNSKIEFIVNKGYTIKVNGENIQSSPNGIYSYTLDLNTGSDFDIKIYDGQNLIYENSYFIERKTEIMNSFDSESISGIEINTADGGNITVNKDSKYSYSGNSIKYELLTYGLSDFNYITWTPSLTLKSEVFDNKIDFSKVFSLSFYVYNAGEETSMRVYLGTGKINQLFSDIKLLEGMNKVTVSVAKGPSFSKLAEANRIILEFDNTEQENYKYVGYLDNFTVSYK